ncbi:4'-phosphopantetheinyl transferase [Phenylobacterium sp.]|uniref:4'-phosphopantetheinyl transferase family protein n=1 Tax=Phenylobacterium sp. TaxID=1871053 RepID=UPI0035678D59
MNGADPVLTWLRDVLPAACGVSGGPIGESPEGPFPEEEAIVGRARAKRVFEFRAGRLHARAALSQAGGAPSPILKGPRGEPLWPTGYAGSISHSDDLAIAVAAPRAAVRAMGLDVDLASPLESDLARIVCHPEELQSARGLDVRRIDPAKRLFVAKEAFIKLYYSMTGTLLDFLEVRVFFDSLSHEYSASLANRSLSSGAYEAGSAWGHMHWNDRTIAAIMWVRADQEMFRLRREIEGGGGGG